MDTYKYLEIPITATLATMGFIGGFIMTSLVIKSNYFKLDQYLKKPFILAKSHDKNVTVLISLTFVLLIVIGVVYYKGPPPVTNAIVSLVLEGSGSDTIIQMGEVRKSLTKSHLFGGTYKGQGLMKVVIPTFWSFLSAFAFAYYLVVKNRKSFFLFIFVFIFAFIYILADGQRAPLLRLFLINIGVYSLIAKISIKKIPYLIAGLAFLVFLSSLVSPKIDQLKGDDGGVQTILTHMLERAILGNAQNDVYAIDFIKNGKLDYRSGGLHKRDFIAAFPGAGGGRPFANELARMIYRNDTTTYLTGTYVTKTYIDFGKTGTFLLFTLMGVFVAVFQKIMFSLSKTPLHIAGIGVLGYTLGNMTNTGPFALISILVIFTVVFILSSFLYYVRFFKRKTET